jgi:hypothetical protein
VQKVCGIELMKQQRHDPMFKGLNPPASGTMRRENIKKV